MGLGVERGGGDGPRDGERGTDRPRDGEGAGDGPRDRERGGDGPDSCRLTTGVPSFSALSGSSSHDAVAYMDTAPVSSPVTNQDSVRAMAVRRAPPPGITAT